MGLAKPALRAGIQIALQMSPQALTQIIRHWNALATRGEIERARSAIRLEFLRNRELAIQIFEKYRGDMDDDVRTIFHELMKGDAHGR